MASRPSPALPGLAAYVPDAGVSVQCNRDGPAGLGVLELGGPQTAKEPRSHSARPPNSWAAGPAATPATPAVHPALANTDSGAAGVSLAWFDLCTAIYHAGLVTSLPHGLSFPFGDTPLDFSGSLPLRF